MRPNQRPYSPALSPNSPPTQPPGADELYTIKELHRRLGFRDAGWRALRRKGLPCHQVGKRMFVFGQDFFEFTRKQAESG